MRSAAERGAAPPDALWRMTPEEFVNCMRLYTARLQNAQLQQWVAARYTALAVHQPDRLPDRPPFSAVPEASMSDAEMKRRLSALTEVTT